MQEQSDPTLPQSFPIEQRRGDGIGVRCRGVVHLYRTVEGHDVVALQGVDLTIAAGERVAMLGPSGSGKSTLLTLLGGIQRPSAGQIYLDDHNIARMGEGELTRLRASRVSTVLQGAHRNLLPYATAEQNIVFAQLGVSRDRRRARRHRDGRGVGVDSAGPRCRASVERSIAWGAMAPRKPLPFDPIEEAARHWAARWDGVASMRAVTSLMRVQQLVIAELDEILSRHQLSFARYEALVLLHFSRRGALPLGKMGERLQVHPTSITSIMRRLESSGYVRREPHPEDRRAVLAHLTASGRTAMEAATRDLVAADFGLSALDATQLAALTDLLRPVRQAAGDFD